MSASVVRWSLLQGAATVGFAIAGCVACSQSEDGPLGSPSYLPAYSSADAGVPEAVSGSFGTGATSGSSAGGLALGGGGSNGGAGGSPMSCSAHAIPVKNTWTVTASSSGANTPITNLYDGDLTNLWSSGKAQAGDEWIEVDFGVEVTLARVTLVLGTATSDYPRQYELRFSDTTGAVGAALVSGAGMASTDTVMAFPAVQTGRYLRISQVGSAQYNDWSSAEIQVQCQD